VERATNCQYFICTDCYVENQYKWSNNFAERPHRMSCRYWGLMLLLHTSQKRLSMLFSGPDNPQKLLLSVGWFWPHLKRGSLGLYEPVHQTASRSLQPFFAQYISVTNTQTHRQTQTALRVTSVAIDCIYALLAMWPNDICYIEQFSMSRAPGNVGMFS